MSGRIDLANESSFELGGVTVHPAELAVTKGDCRFELQPRVMQVLVALAQDAPGVVSRDRLIERCWDVKAISDDAINRCIMALRTLASQIDPPQFAIETIPRVGHRLSLTQDALTSGNRSRTSTVTIDRKLGLASLALVVVAALVFGIVFWREGAGAEAKVPTLAVLPFRDLSGGDGTMAAGFAEDVLAELAAGRDFVLMGRYTAGALDPSGDVRTVGQELGVDYLLEGTVRSQPGKVRVTVALLHVMSGRRVWSDSYDRTLADEMATQQSVGQSVAANVREALGLAARGSDVRLSNRTYATYLEALGMLRAENPEAAAQAVKLLETVVRDERRFAPGWLALSKAIELASRGGDADAMIEALPRALAAARTATRLAPETSAAHIQLSNILGGDSPEAVAHLRRAADLAPRSAEDYAGRARAYSSVGREADALEAYREAHRLDRFYGLPTRAIVDLEALLSDRATAEASARRLFADDPATLAFALGRLAWFYGDLSQAAHHWRKAAATSMRFARPAERSLADLDRLFGRANPLSDAATRPTIGHDRYRPRDWVTMAPTASQWRLQNRSSAASIVHHNRNILDAKLMLRAGRGRELLVDYDSPRGLLGVFRDAPMIACQLYEAPLVILALRQGGRTREADALLRKARRLVAAQDRLPRKPRLFDDDAAAIAALSGNADEAIARLDRARRSGWLHLGSTDMPRIEDEPVFASLARRADFRALAGRYRADLARESREWAAAPRD